MLRDYLLDGEVGFVGLNSRDNPSNLPKGFVSESVNMRLDRGVAKARRGLKKYSTLDTYGAGKNVVGSGTYLNSNGQEIIVILIDDTVNSVTKLYTFNGDLGSFGVGVTLPVRITSQDGVEIAHAMDRIFISRGHNARPLMWDFVNPPSEILTTDEFPNCTGIMYFKNRLIAIGKHLQTTDNARKRDSICVSHYLQYNKWKHLDEFTVNQGGNDEIVGVVPWTVNEFLILCRNSTFYLNVGSGRYVTGDALEQDARLDTLSVDIGCAARKSAVQVGTGVMFLSDNGVYMLVPANTSAPDGVKLLTLTDPVSAPIDDIIQRINKNYVHQAVAAYWNNRYYLAVPVNKPGQPDATKNNTVLVYNFILKAWESVDEYPDEVDVMGYAVSKKNNQRRLFFIDSNEGIFLTEESEKDQIGTPTGTPILSERLSWRLSTNDYGDSREITGTLVTRRFTAGDGKDKRFSSVESDMFVPSGSIVETYAITTNPDTETKIDEFIWSYPAEDSTRRNPVRKTAYGLQIKFKTLRLQPEIRSNYVKFTVNRKTNANSN